MLWGAGGFVNIFKITRETHTRAHTAVYFLLVLIISQHIQPEHWITLGIIWTKHEKKEPAKGLADSGILCNPANALFSSIQHNIFFYPERQKATKQLFSSLQKFPGSEQNIFLSNMKKCGDKKFNISYQHWAALVLVWRVENVYILYSQATWELFLSLDISEGPLKCHPAALLTCHCVRCQPPGSRCQWPDVWHQRQDGPGLGGTCLSTLWREDHLLSPFSGILFRIQLHTAPTVTRSLIAAILNRKT